MKLSHTLLFLSAAIGLGQAASIPRAAETAPPKLTLVLTAKVTASEGIVIGNLTEGYRVAYPITGGTFTGPKLKGKLLPVGADFSITRTDGSFSPDGIAILQTNDGANILFKDQGFQNGKYVYGQVSLTTGAKKYSWLNQAILVSRALVTTGDTSAGVGLEIFQVGGD